MYQGLSVGLEGSNNLAMIMPTPEPQKQCPFKVREETYILIAVH